ncbi:MAG: protein kinase, partial [Nannocystaceae bacterium]
MIGDRLADRYEVLAELGQGGMGVVYLGRDQVLGREVAIKVIAATTGLSDAAEHRFRGEAQTIAQLDHPSIVSIFDFGTHDGRFFYVMPVIEGRSLRELIDRKALSESMVIEIGGGVAEALAYTHARGIVHRDIKPENIMVALGDEGRPRVTLMDFGLARGITDDPLTKTGLLIGTVTYLSPEQVAGRVADAASDLYALGTVLYEALSGQPPFVGETQAVLYRIVHEYPALLRDRGVDVDEELEALVMGCLAKEAGERPAQAVTVARALRQIRARHLRSGGHDEVTMVSTPLRRGALSPLIGRIGELGELQQRLSRALAGEGNFVALGGEVGAGKTRLIAELEALARARGAAVLHGNLAEQAGAFPYFGFCEIFVDFFRSRGSTGGDALPDLSDLAPELVAIFPTLAEIEALRPRSGGEPLAEVALPRDHKQIAIDNRQQIFETVARALVRLSQATPLCLIFEDLHAADAAIEPLHYIVRRLAASPALILATYRTTEVDRGHPVTRLVDELRSSRRFTHLILANLSKSEHKVLLGTLLGEAPPEAAA